MNKTEELLDEIKLRKKGLSLIMDNQNITVEDIKNTFYRLSDYTQSLGVQYFRLDAYNIVSGDFIMNIKYTKDNKTYYMIVGANSYHAAPQQIAVGTAIHDKVYMTCESFPDTSSLDFVAFPKFTINQKTKGFALKSYRDTMHLFNLLSFSTPLANESEMCLEAGIEAIDVFCLLINQIKNQDKRKKLNI